MISAVGIAWYRESDYPRILQIMEDADLLHATFLEWQKAAEQAERMSERNGTPIIRAIIDPQEFPAWCRARGLNVDAGARMAFANEFARGLSKHLD